MRVQYASDLHLEFDTESQNFIIDNTTQADMLILAGDIFVAEDLNRADLSSKFFVKEKIEQFLLYISKQFSTVIMIMGNHEHYAGYFYNTKNIITKTINSLGINNIHFLDKEYVIIDGVYIYGATMWTNYGGSPVVKETARYTMNDFRQIRVNSKDWKKLDPDIILDDHIQAKYLLNKMLSSIPSDSKVIVVTHHAPSSMSVHPKYRNDTVVNLMYHSDMTPIMYTNRNIKVWIHGHTHDSFDYTIYDTNVLCNPRGYNNYEENSKFIADKFFDI